jgi:hypothetical protein
MLVTTRKIRTSVPRSLLERKRTHTQAGGSEVTVRENMDRQMDRQCPEILTTAKSDRQMFWQSLLEETRTDDGRSLQTGNENRYVPQSSTTDTRAEKFSVVFSKGNAGTLTDGCFNSHHHGKGGRTNTQTIRITLTGKSVMTNTSTST